MDVDEYLTGDGKRKEVVKIVMEVAVHEGMYVGTLHTWWCVRIGHCADGLYVDMLNGAGNLHGGCSGLLIGAYVFYPLKYY